MIKLEELREVFSNDEAALLDMGDGIACLQFRSKGNSISKLVREFITEILANNIYDFDGMIIASQSKHFSVGANLANMKINIDSGNFDEMENNVASFQAMTSSLKYSKKPIVAVPYRMTLGGGLEVALHCSARVALAKCYMGLVETGVGLLPGGGGTKYSAYSLMGLEGEELNLATINIFDNLIMGKVSKNAQDAKGLGYLRDGDIIVENEDVLIETAKNKCLEMISEKFVPSIHENIRLAGKNGYDMLLKHGENLMENSKITPYDLEIAKKISLILTGSKEEPSYYSEQEVLDLERRCFVELTKSRGTYERIEYFLRTNEKLRN